MKLDNTYRKMLKREFSIYFPTFKDYVRCRALREHDYYIWNFQKLLRKEEFCRANHLFLFQAYYRWRRNILGAKLGFLIPAGVFDEGLRIWHYGNIIVNGYSRVGKNCSLHGDNCIGNDGKTGDAAPIIGDNVDIGVGAKVIGRIVIGDNTVIAGGAVVVKSFEDKDITIGGVPAVKIK